ncbi:arsenate reductase/protein-tyrosine-phosphatase family protein [Marimonas arenosa]|uniref:Helix-turn-helix domain-containing protein n=1 Tax=Marimonas arenosa TaxID=1795305 RepID=A0AAE3WGY5_9RHOB|nr:helix-turn-helix domain-containing protein [Marimonas arenosa]MDQ2092454.1 helix-turn-helix domain-containing protein [Marimonas arenosa]
MESLQIDRLTALGHAGRMALFRLLVRRYPEFVPAGELADALGVKKNTMSVYLSALVRAGLLKQRRDGRNLLYQADIDGADDLVSYLFDDCCRGRPSLCVSHMVSEHDADAGARKMPEAHTYNALFVCTGNSARSLFAEALLRDLGSGRFNAYSAGTHPSSHPNPIAMEMLHAKGHDISPLRSKGVDEFQADGAPIMDFVFTVCDQAANEECPAWAGQPITAHWGVPNPVKAKGTDAERQLAFQQAYGILKNRISLFTALHPENLERATLQARLDDISTQGDPK